MPADRSRNFIVPTGIILLARLLISSPADATVFDSPPSIEDRKVTLRWQADPDDPLFTGNTVLEEERTFTHLHEAGRAVRDLTFTSFGTEVYSYAEGSLKVVHWRFEDGLILGELDLPATAAPADLSLHGTNRYLLAALDSGEVAFWDVASVDPPVLHRVSREPLHAARFFPGIPDTTDLRFVTAGEDDTIRVFRAPDQLLYRMVVPDGPSYALEISQNGVFVAAGGEAGKVRIWNISRPPLSPDLLLEGHAGAIVGLAITRDRSRIASVDDTGQIRIWNFSTGALLASFETGLMAEPPRIGFTVPDGQVLFVGLPDGTIALHDGVNGAGYLTQGVLDDPLTALEVNPDGKRVVLGDAEGTITILRGGRCTPSEIDRVCFGGYKIWRSRVPNPGPGEARLLRVYGFGDSTWSFVGEDRVFTDPDSIIPRTGPFVPDDDEVDDPIVLAGPHNGVSYFYSITRFNKQFLNGAVFDVFPDGADAIARGFYRDPGSVNPTPVVPEPVARAELPLLDRVVVVPNPYERGRVTWEQVGTPHVEFRNLPESATIRLYSVAGDLVRVLEHGRGRYGESRAAAEWDLKNSAGREVTSGIYVYQVETPSGEIIQGYLALVL